MRSIPPRVEASAKSKYGAKPTTVDGVRFHSRRESERYRELRLLEKAGEIADLRLQPELSLDAVPNWGSGGVVGMYRADFFYFDNRRKREVWEDVKGFDTPLSKWKRKHVAAQYGITVEIVK